MIQLKALSVAAKIRGLRQSDLARLAGVSRQAVSLWFKSADGIADVQSSHLVPLCGGLGIAVEDLTEPFPDLGAARASTETALLWDRLYPDLEAFAMAAAAGEPRALARLAEAYGLHGAARAAGKAVWTRFEEYERFVPPGRREGLRRAWINRTSPKRVSI